MVRESMNTRERKTALRIVETKGGREKGHRYMTGAVATGLVSCVMLTL